MKTLSIYLCLMLTGGLALASPKIKDDQDKPARLYVASDTQQMDSYSGPAGGGGGFVEQYWDKYEQQWRDGVGGQGAAAAKETVGLDGGVVVWDNVSQYVWLADGSGTEYFTENYWGYSRTNAIGAPPIYNEHCEVNDSGHVGTYVRHAQTEWRLQTGGRTGRKSLWRLSAAATEIFMDDTGRPITPPAIRINGQALGADGNLWTVLPANANVAATPYVAGVDYYTFSVNTQKYLSHFEVFVHQPWPDLNYQPWVLSGGPPPLGWPIVNGFDAGHAWWKLISDAPKDIVNQYTIPHATNWINSEVGYGPLTQPSISDWLNTIFWNWTIDVSETGILPYSYNKESNISKTYAIGFPGLVAALNHTEAVHEFPGVWYLRHLNCVTETVITGDDAGVILPDDWDPEDFGFHLPPDNP